MNVGRRRFGSNIMSEPSALTKTPSTESKVISSAMAPKSLPDAGMGVPQKPQKHW